MIKTGRKERYLLGEKTKIVEKNCITVVLNKDFINKIDDLVNETKQFKSRDDFIQLACHEFLVRRNPAGELLKCLYVFLGAFAIASLQDLVEPAITVLSYIQA
jgi:Arc/MetJ-type ribon-helix-helix transcriptional regulator